VVNQLLSKLDGVAERNNVLVVGLTNRKELIDPALLRPGRLEVHVELKLPDLTGRKEILLIALRNMTASGLLAPDCLPEEIVPWLAERTEGFSGADIAGLVRSAASFSIKRAFDVALPSFEGSISAVVERQQLMVEVCRADFREALAEASASAVKDKQETQ
jgi:vesicle-fusing ATPase